MKIVICALLLVSGHALAVDPIAVAAAKDRANDMESYCKATANLAKVVVEQVRDNDPRLTKHWVDEMKAKKGTLYSDIIADAFLKSSFMGPLETEASIYKECKKGKYNPNSRK